MRGSCEIWGLTQAQSGGFSYIHTIHFMIYCNSMTEKKMRSELQAAEPIRFLILKGIE